MLRSDRNGRKAHNGDGGTKRALTDAKRMMVAGDRRRFKQLTVEQG